MVLSALIHIFKPVVLVWAGLNAIDDLTTLFRVGRLVAVLIPGGKENDMCAVCDDLMGDLLSGTDGLKELPCRYVCLGIPGCINMCEELQSKATDAQGYPCVAAGYCTDDEDDADKDGWDGECERVPILRCEPERYCKRVREGLRMKCKLKPGIGRWNSVKNAIKNNIGAAALGLAEQPHCGEPNAGKLCIAKPRGLGLIAEMTGHILSLGYGGLRTIKSIESPGGDDDRQWLTFWLMLTIMLFIERFLARVVLSKVPIYYECKLLLLCWLIFGGADKVYRKLRRFLMKKKGSWFGFELGDSAMDKMQLEAMKKLLGDDHKQFVKNATEQDANLLRKLAPGPFPTSRAAGGVLLDKKTRNFSAGHVPVFEELGESRADELYMLSNYLLNAGRSNLDQAELPDSSKKELIERAAAVVSFQPRFLYVRLIGTPDGQQVKASDANGRSDPYAVLQLKMPDERYPERRVYSGIKRKTVTPKWNQEFELPLRAGLSWKQWFQELYEDTDGVFRSAPVASSSSLHLQVFDADIGLFGWVYFVSMFACCGMWIAAAIFWLIGIIDDWSPKQYNIAVGVVIMTMSVFVTSYILFRRFSVDDDLLGEASVPLNMLMDQKKHTLRVALSTPEGEGKAGVVDLALEYSER